MFTLYPGSNLPLRITLEGREPNLFAGDKITHHRFLDYRTAEKAKWDFIVQG